MGTSNPNGEYFPPMVSPEEQAVYSLGNTLIAQNHDFGYDYFGDDALAASFADFVPADDSFLEGSGDFFPEQVPQAGDFGSIPIDLTGDTPERDTGPVDLTADDNDAYRDDNYGDEDDEEDDDDDDIDGGPIDFGDPAAYNILDFNSTLLPLPELGYLGETEAPVAQEPATPLEGAPSSGTDHASSLLSTASEVAGLAQTIRSEYDELERTMRTMRDLVEQVESRAARVGALANDANAPWNRRERAAVEQQQQQRTTRGWKRKHSEALEEDLFLEAHASSKRPRR